MTVCIISRSASKSNCFVTQPICFKCWLSYEIKFALLWTFWGRCLSSKDYRRSNIKWWAYVSTCPFSTSRIFEAWTKQIAIKDRTWFVIVPQYIRIILLTYSISWSILLCAVLVHLRQIYHLEQAGACLQALIFTVLHELNGLSAGKGMYLKSYTVSSRIISD